LGLASDCGRSGGHLAGHGRLSWEAPKRPFFFVLPPFWKGIELFFSAELGCLRLGIFRGTSNGKFGCETLLLSIQSPTRNTPPRCRPQVPPPKTIPTWQTTEAQPRKAAFGPSAARGLEIPKKSRAHIPVSAASILTSRPPQNDGSCARQPGDFPVGDSCGSEPNKRQFAQTKLPTNKGKLQ
jgi:hypothetical protein